MNFQSINLSLNQKEIEKGFFQTRAIWVKTDVRPNATTQVWPSRPGKPWPHCVARSARERLGRPTGRGARSRPERRDGLPDGNS
jgi:hypothetical protein